MRPRWAACASRRAVRWRGSPDQPKGGLRRLVGTVCSGSRRLICGRSTPYLAHHDSVPAPEFLPSTTPSDQAFILSMLHFSPQAERGDLPIEDRAHPRLGRVDDQVVQPEVPVDDARRLRLQEAGDTWDKTPAVVPSRPDRPLPLPQSHRSVGLLVSWAVDSRPYQRAGMRPGPACPP